MSLKGIVNLTSRPGRFFTALWFSFAVLTAHAGGTVTYGYITAVLRSGCTDAPTPPPPVGGTNLGPDYVIMTVADANPTDWDYAQQVVTDAIFESLMPLYCGLPETTNNCVTDSVQWNIITYDVNGQPLTSGCAASGCEMRSCAGFESGPPFIVTQPVGQSVNSGQTVTFNVDVSGATPLYYQWVFNGTNVLTGATNAVLALTSAQTNQAGLYQVEIYNALGGTNSQPAMLTVNPGPAATNGYITAVLRSDCTDSPTPPPPVGSTRVGADYVIMTVADADPADWDYAQQVVTDAIFESLMPLYCGLPETTNNCVTDSVQWNIITYDVNGQPRSSGCAASGCEMRSCAGFESGPPFIVTQPVGQSVNSGQTVTFNVDVSGAAPLYYQWVFDGTNALAGATNAALVLPKAQTNQAGLYQVEVYNAIGGTNSLPVVLTVNPGPAATNGYITAVLRSDCTDSPSPPPPVGSTRVGADYVIMTVADASPTNWAYAQQVVTDAIFKSLMPLYCGLPQNGCVTNLVQWGILTYDVNGQPRISGCAASGCEFHSCTGGETVTLPPALKISAAPSQLGLSWSTMAADFALEESTNLVNWYPVTWQTATNVKAISTQVPDQGNGHFFRLRQK